MISAISERPPPLVPHKPTPASLEEAVQRCCACDLWEGATQPVMGAGAQPASLMFVGEQPGDPMKSRLAELVTVTAHPSAILRAREEQERSATMDELVADLANVAQWLGAR